MISTSISNFLPAIFPIVLTVLLGVIGLGRGVRREAVVSAAIVLGAFIVEHWGASWSDDLYALYTGVSRDWHQLVLSYLLMILVVLVVGYGLGKRVLTLPVTRASRTWGLLLGLANGAALSGWLLRYIYTNLDGSQATSPLYQDGVSYGFMIWAGWFPVALAAIGAVAALLSPLRRVQTVVAQPSSATNWAPTPATTITATPATVVSTPTNVGGYSQPISPIHSSLAPTQPYNAQPYAPPYCASMPSYAPAPPPPSMPPTSSGPYRTETTETVIEHDAPSTRLFPVGEVSPSATDAYEANPQGSATRNFVPPSTNNPPQEAGATDSGSLSAPSEWMSGAPPSWLIGGSGGASDSGSLSPHASPSPDVNTNNPISPGFGGNEVPRSTPITGPLSAEALATKTCRNCGAAVPANARFCTDCGTPITQA